MLLMGKEELIMFILSLVSVCLLWLISIIHVYWAFGGQWGTGAVIPSKEGSLQAAFSPRKGETLCVALLVLLASIIILVQGGYMTALPASTYSKVGSIACAIVFCIRAIGDFKYVGFFKTIKHSPFAKNDTKLYSPLCLFLSFVYIMLLL
jgi:hypothetical protein